LAWSACWCDLQRGDVTRYEGLLEMMNQQYSRHNVRIVHRKQGSRREGDLMYWTEFDVVGHCLLGWLPCMCGALSSWAG